MDTAEGRRVVSGALPRRRAAERPDPIQIFEGQGRGVVHPSAEVAGAGRGAVARGPGPRTARRLDSSALRAVQRVAEAGAEPRPPPPRGPAQPRAAAPAAPGAPTVARGGRARGADRLGDGAGLGGRRPARPGNSARRPLYRRAFEATVSRAAPQ